MSIETSADVNYTGKLNKKRDISQNWIEFRQKIIKPILHKFLTELVWGKFVFTKFGLKDFSLCLINKNLLQIYLFIYWQNYNTASFLCSATKIMNSSFFSILRKYKTAIIAKLEIILEATCQFLNCNFDSLRKLGNCYHFLQVSQ